MTKLVASPGYISYMYDVTKLHAFFHPVQTHFFRSRPEVDRHRFSSLCRFSARVSARGARLHKCQPTAVSSFPAFGGPRAVLAHCAAMIGWLAGCLPAERSQGAPRPFLVVCSYSHNFAKFAPACASRKPERLTALLLANHDPSRKKGDAAVGRDVTDRGWMAKEGDGILLLTHHSTTRGVSKGGRARRFAFV